MAAEDIMRHLAAVGVATLVGVPSAMLPAVAQTNLSVDRSKVCWINVATGVPVPPEAIVPTGTRYDPSDPNHAVNPGHAPTESFPQGVPSVTYVRTSDGGWINAATGVPVPSNALVPTGTRYDSSDPNHAVNPGHAPTESFPQGVPSVTYVRVPCPETKTASSTSLYIGGGYAWNTSTTTITSPTDRQKIKQDPSQVMITGRANLGPWFLTGQVQFAGTPSGSFSDVFFATPAFNTTAAINSGQVYGFNGDAGYTLWNADGWTVGIFGGYYSFNEELYGMFPGFTGTFALLSDHWRAGEGGVSIDKAFAIGAEPFDLGVTVAGLADNLRAGAFNGNGGGWRANGTLSFPLGPVMGNIYAQYANLNASGSNTGVPLTFKDEVWTVGFGVTYKFGAPPAAAAPSYPVKALPTK